MLDLDHVAVAAIVLGDHDLARRGRHDRGAGLGPEIDAGMHREAAGERVGAVAVIRGKVVVARHRPGERQLVDHPAQAHDRRQARLEGVEGGREGTFRRIELHRHERSAHAAGRGGRSG